MIRLFVAILSVLLAAPHVVCAHPISVTDAFVHVGRDKSTVQITIYLEDLYLFHDLEPNQLDFLPLTELKRGGDLHREFLMERFAIRNARGERIKPEFVRVEEPELPDNGVPLAELMTHRMTYEFRYPTDKPPEFLTISQTFVDEEIAIPAEMRLVIQQANSGVAFTAALGVDQPRTVRFDWSGEPLSEEASQAELEAWFEKQKNQTLGITNYGAVYSFLYIEDSSVRHEILMPLLTLSEDVPMPRRDKSFLEVEEQAALRPAIEAFFRDGNPISIDGRQADARVSRLDFFGVDFKDFAKASEPTRVSMASGRVGVILTYPLVKPPGKVELLWNRFNKSVYAVQMIVYSHEKTERKTLAKLGGANRYAWNSSKVREAFRASGQQVDLQGRPQWTIPCLSVGAIVLSILAYVAIWPFWRVLAAGLVAAVLLSPWGRWTTPSPLATPPRISEEGAKQVVGHLLSDTYRAFGLHDEEASYDALAVTTDDLLREELYLQIRQSLLMQDQGGAVARVREVLPESGRLLPHDLTLADERAFRYRMTWTVQGEVEHWGHIHSRTNRYDAMFQVEPRDDQWRFTDIEVLEDRRVKADTRLRGQ